MLTGIRPIPTGHLLAHVDVMGHSDAVVLADAHLDRHAFYDAASAAYLIARTGETRIYGNAILRKGVVTATGER